MNRQHLLAFLWLRWRLRVNQVKKAGVVNAVITAIFAVAMIPSVVVLFVGAFLAGLLAVPQAEPHVPLVILFAWDGLLVVFLFFWAIGVLSDLQRSDALSLDKFLHLPVSLSGVFLINYFTSLFSVTLFLFLPPMLGFALGLIFAAGPAMLLVLPLLASFVLALTALTYQFQGWLASLMVNQRRRRTVIALLTIGFVLLFQLPNAVNMMQPWNRGKAVVPHAGQSAAQTALDDALNTRQITLDEFLKRKDELQKQSQAERAEQESREWESAEEIGRLVNLAVPPGWLALGAMDLARGDVLPALLGTLGLGAIGTASLWRSYRTTVRLYTGQFTAGTARPAVPAPLLTPKPAGVLLVERDVPGMPDQAAAIALASFRSLLRAPEAKMMLLSPLILLGVFGSMLFTQRVDPPEPLRFLMVSGAMVMNLLGMVQFVGNQFGFDRAGFRVFVLSPVPRRNILLGKNVSAAPLAIVPALVMAIVVEAIYPMGPDYFLASLVQMISMYLVFCLLANLLSILAPMPVAPGTMKMANPKLLSVLIVLLFVSLFPMALTPTLLPLGIAVLLESQGWTGGLPVCLLLSVALCLAIAYLYRLVLPWQGRLLQAREQKILTVVTTKAE